MRAVIAFFLMEGLIITPLLVAEPIRLATRAFEAPLRVEARDLPADRGERIVRRAIEQVLLLQQLSDLKQSGSGGIGQINAAAGDGPQPVAEELFPLLERALAFCFWSGGAHGPLGGELYEEWGLRRPADARPAPEELRRAVATAACRNLSLEPETGRASLAAGSRLDLWGFAAGYAVDRAAEILRAEGVTNGYVELGWIRRGFGPGPDGRGWRVTLPVPPAGHEPLGVVWLRDRSLALTRLEDHPLTAGGERLAPYLDQRRGEPAEGVVAVAAVAELALDAHALASALFILGNREGQYRAGQLSPPPSVRWLLGTGDGRPLVVDFNWWRAGR